jgi:hypothetical protein
MLLYVQNPKAKREEFLTLQSSVWKELELNPAGEEDDQHHSLQ